MKKEHLEETGTEESFAQMLDASYKEPSRLEPGQSVLSTIVKISADWALIEVGGKGEGYLDKKELLDSEGNLTVKEGQKIRAYFIYSENGEMHFTSKIGAGPAAYMQLAEAMRAGVRVEGTVSKETRGGFEITVSGGARAFCPFSHMGLRRDEDREGYIGRVMQFDIAECEPRKVVLSRRNILEKERQEKVKLLKSTLEEGMRVKGVVTSIQKFGAFVDIGGIDGLIPVSEIAWDRTENVGDRLSVGQPVEVAIKRLDWANERISLSLRDILPNPWDSAEKTWPAGSYHKGKITRLTQFGAFVLLGDGVEGLIHISRLGGERRLQHPEEVVQKGQEIEVKVEAVDQRSRKIALVPAEAAREADEDAAAMQKYRQPDAVEEENLGTLGEVLRRQMEKKQKGEK
ncbi:MAG: 30S ribosomal protein S1 [Elusimicrobia bacterium RIFOXYB2_FULL_62_6]|nr:MAG: 30S ribosomal protein S1 [Elusimicrobia bacterium RIFOXYB2_FULL_62_6]